MVGMLHPDRTRLRHVAGNAHIAGAGICMVRMIRGILDLFLMAGQAGIIGLSAVREPIAPARGMALEAAELT